MTQDIARIDDAKAIRLLSSFATAQLHEKMATAPSTKLVDAISKSFALSQDASRVPSEGDVARAALQVLAQDKTNREAFSTYLAGPSATKFSLDPVSSIALLTMAVAVLQTRATISWKDGELSIAISKDAAGSSTLKTFAQVIIDYWRTIGS